MGGVRGVVSSCRYVNPQALVRNPPTVQEREKDGKGKSEYDPSFF